MCELRDQSNSSGLRFWNIAHFDRSVVINNDGLSGLPAAKKKRKPGQTKSPLSAKTTIWSNQLLKRNQSELKEELWLYFLYLVGPALK